MYYFVGSGPATFYSVLKLLTSGVNGSDITIYDKGKSITERKSNELLYGFGGAGAFSDYKMVFDPTINHGISKEDLDEYFRFLLIMSDGYGTPIPKKEFPEQVSSQFQKYRFRDGTSDVLHIGTRGALKILTHIESKLKKEGVNLVFDKIFTGISEDSISFSDGETVKLNASKGDKVFIALGRTGQKTIVKLMKDRGINYKPKVIDLGFRVETKMNSILKEISRSNYDMKIIRDLEGVEGSFSKQIRTFCVNHNSANVAIENTPDREQANGHSYGNAPKDYNGMSNWAVLATIKMSSGDELEDYMSRLDSLTGKKVVKDVSELAKQLPSMQECCEFIEDLAQVLSIKSYNLYIPEVKNRNELQSDALGIKGVYLVGDCAYTRGIVPSAVSCMKNL